MFRRFSSLVGAAAFILSLASSGANAQQPLQLKMATVGPPNAYFYTEVLIPWMEAVNRDSQGTLNIRHFGGGVLANAGNMYDSVLNGAADLGWVLLGSGQGKLVKSSVVELPFGYEKGEAGATALWRLYEKGVIASDFDNLKVFGFTAWPTAAIQTKSKKIQTLEDMKGVKLRVSGRWQAATVSAFAATPVSLPVDETYQAIDKSVIDGAWTSLVATRQFRLEEITKYFLDAPLNGGGGMIVMKRETYDKRPPAAKAAFEKRSGETLSRALGKSNDGEVVRVKTMLNNLASQGKLNAPYSLSATEFERWKKAAGTVTAAWVPTVPDGAAVLDAYRAEVSTLEPALK